MITNHFKVMIVYMRLILQKIHVSISQISGELGFYQPINDHCYKY